MYTYIFMYTYIYIYIYINEYIYIYRFHCLTLDISPPISPIIKTNTPINNKNIQYNSNNFPTLNSSKINKIPEINKINPVKIPKMSLNKCLERYFEIELLGKDIRKIATFDHLPLTLIIQLSRYSYECIYIDVYIYVYRTILYTFK
jgi:hypothetical protein